MHKETRDFLGSWPRNFIRDEDFANFTTKSADARHSFIKRAIKSGQLIRLRRGLYLISNKIKQQLPNDLELAQLLYSPSIISLELALSHHGWIPERVYTISSTTPKRAKTFDTPIGVFAYVHVPEKGFYKCVSRIATPTGSMLIADPWRALADLMYTRRKSWPSLAALNADMRIDEDDVFNSDVGQLEELCTGYPSPFVQRNLKLLLTEIQQTKLGSKS